MMSGAWLFVGGLVGVLDGLCLRRTVTVLHPTAPRRAVAWVMGGVALRWLAVAGVLWVAVRESALAALWAFAGLWLARWVFVGCWFWRPVD
jgi:hypothetical protein